MNRILIIEDNKTLAKLISKKISKELPFEVDVAYKLGEAKLFLKMYEYFVVLTDLNLPDAPDGEVVDYLIKKEAHTIVLTSNADKEFRKNILKKDIIDYVNKGGSNEINYIISTIQRLHKNKNHKVLVVDDSMVVRKQMQIMLEQLFINVYTVAHGEEALGMLQTHPDISLVLTDYNMPVMDGMELTKKIRETHSKNDLGIIAISSSDDDEINSLFLKHGANDYVKKPFSKEEFSCRVNNALESIENIQIITNHANRDYLTGLYNRRFFNSHMNTYLDDQAHEDGQLFISMIHIDNLQEINDTYGQEIGDKVLVDLSEILSSTTKRKDLVSRFSGQDFCIVLKGSNTTEVSNTLEEINTEVKSSSIYGNNGEKINFTTSIGASMHEYDNNDFEETLNQADMMLYKAKQNGGNQIVFE